MGISQPPAARRASVYGFVDGAYVRNELSMFRQVRAAAIAGVGLETIGAPVGGAHPALVRTFLYDVPEDDDVTAWLEANEREADTRVVNGMIRGRRRRQKAVDVGLAVDALFHAALGHFEIAVIVAGDADFVPVAERLTDLGAHVAVVGWEHSMSDDLRRASDRVGYFSENEPTKLWNGNRLLPS